MRSSIKILFFFVHFIFQFINFILDLDGVPSLESDRSIELFCYIITSQITIDS